MLDTAYYIYFNFTVHAQLTNLNATHNSIRMDATQEQQDILSCQGSFRVLAAAGSGKTTTMATYVKQEVQGNRTKEHDICFITYTRFAAKQIQDKVSAILGYRAQLLTGTFHKTMYILGHRASIIASHHKGLYDSCMEEGVQRFLEHMRKQTPSLTQILKRFRILIVDEFQDLDGSQFEFVQLFKAINPSLRIIAIGDLAQNIYRFRGTSNEFLRTRLLDLIPDMYTFQLTTNFRSTPAILTFVNMVFKDEIKEGHILPMVPIKGKAYGMKPQIYEYAKNPSKGLGEYEELVVETILPIIKKAKDSKKSVALIFPMLKAVSYNYITALIFEKSKALGFTPDFHQITKEDETCATQEFTYDPSNKLAPVQKSTIHSSKGLEWDIVAIINITDSMYELRGEDEDTEAFIAEKTNLLYVGLTRAAEELYIFGDANMGGRNRLFARLDDKLKEVADVHLWGTEQKDYEQGRMKPIGVKDLIRKLPQHKDLYDRIKEVTKDIQTRSREGSPIVLEDIYTEMKKRNRELSFGTFIDWKLKQEMCKGESNTIQECILELLGDTAPWLHKAEAYEELPMRLAKLHVHFLNQEKEPNAELRNYVSASRHLALSMGRLWAMVDSLRKVYLETQALLRHVYKKEDRSLRDEYILSQTLNFYKNSVTSEIQAASAPEDTYQGLPCGFDSFMVANMKGICEAVRACLDAVGAGYEQLKGDVPLESKSLILGEADIVSNSMLMEIKCGTATKPAELRDSGNCKNMLQVLAYVALGRHGELPLTTRWASLLNPLTGAWEIYELDTWSKEQSLEFMEVLEELRRRV